MTELKPCPFCGNKNVGMLTTLLDCTIFCRFCGASVHKTNYIVCNTLSETLIDAEPEAIAAWNRRAEDDNL